MARALAAAGAAFALFVGLAKAAPLEPVLSPSAALQCLVAGEGESARLLYPEESLKRKEGGTVAVELRFTRPDAGPDVQFSGDSDYAALRDAVRSHVRRFRVPCMVAQGEPVVLRQEYVFIPNDGRKVVATTPHDDADEQRRAQMRCLVHPGPEKKPEYPKQSVEKEESGNFLVRMRFTAPDRPPEPRVLAMPRRPGYLRSAVLDFVEGYRLPCLVDAQMEVDMQFMFRFEGDRRVVLRDMTLRDFLAGAQDLPQPAFFDLGSMQCPFDVRVTYEQPYKANYLGQLDGPVGSRKPLLDWLSRITLKLSEDQQNAVLGDEFTLRVPCGKVDL